MNLWLVQVGWQVGTTAKVGGSSQPQHYADCLNYPQPARLLDTYLSPGMPAFTLLELMYSDTVPIYVYIYISEHMSLFMRICLVMHMYMHSYVYVQAYVYVYVPIYVYVYAYTQLCVCILYMYMYMHSYAQISRDMHIIEIYLRFST